ncbi:DUF1127 domain-containing protein [uncultured Sulfitobacter sp.]|uniref:DUF1127 domain-containing protein n=1 Tax=uncultured Sulfitobacter sp. TaxID=191468 RepID=UPI002636706C|nr:DUF1127 domain-containing protein [uncultured Sulfitobacter sp.]
MFGTLTRLFPLTSGIGPGLWARIQTARALYRSRRALGNLSAHELADIGISEADAQREARRTSWDAPANWTC